MSGYWIYERGFIGISVGEFHSLDDMWDYIRDNEIYFDEVDFERWINDNYTAATVVFDLDRESENKSVVDVWLEYVDAFEEDNWYPEAQDEDLVEGYDYHYGPHGEYTFKWVETEEEE